MEKDERLQHSLATLETAVEGIQDSDTFRAYLNVQARFHQYSPNNALLIMSQKPNAQKVAGYRTWRGLGRQVRQGEQAIRIIAPAPYKTKEVDDPSEEREVRRLSFRSVPVFDISQTDGKTLPAFHVPLLYGDEGEELYTQLEGLALEEGVVVRRGSERFRANPSIMGYYVPDQRSISIREAAQLQMTKTLAHELGHHFSEHEASTPSTETEAESIAYVVLAHFGLDSGERSFPYVATWAQDRHTLRAALGRIQSVSRLMIDRLEGDGGLPEEQ